MSGGSGKESRWRRELLEDGLFVLLVCVGGWVGFAIVLPGTTVGVIWPPAGVVVAAVALRGLNHLLPALAVATLIQVLPILLENASLSYSLRFLGVALIHSLLSAVVAAVGVRSIRERKVFGLREFLRVLVMGGVVAQAVSALFGAGGMVLLGVIPAGLALQAMLFWWSANLLSVGLFAVWGLSLARPDVPLRELWATRSLAIFALVLVGSSLAFFSSETGWLGVIHLEVLVVFLVLMAAITLGIAGATTAAVLCSALALAGTIAGKGAFAHPGSLGGLVSLQTYMLTIVATAFILGDTRARWKAAVRELSAVGEWFRAVFDGVHDAVLVIDPAANRIDRSNARAQDLFQQRSEALEGPLDRSPLAAEGGPLAPGRRPALLQALEAGEPIAGEWKLERGDGSTFWADGAMRLSVLGGQERLLFTLRDVSDRKEAQSERESIRAQLLQSQKLETVGLLAGGIAHDFNNLLMAMMGYAEILESQLEGDARQCARDIQEVAERGAQLTRRILAFSRKQPLNRVPSDLNQVVAGAVKLLDRLMGEHIQVSFRPAEKPAVALADPGQMEQVIVNLATNARDAMPRGGRFDLSLETVSLAGPISALPAPPPPGVYHLLEAIDTGCGMSAEIQERIFEPFFTTKEVGKGTGLGLATTYGILKAHDGYVVVASSVDVGTTFRIYLPNLDAQVAPRITVASTRPAGAGERLLVVEDDEAIRGLMVSALEHAGYRLLVAADGAEALRLFHANVKEVDAVVSDVVMPAMSGPELVQAMRQERPELPVILLSGFPEEIYRDSKFWDPTFELIQKPVLTTVLLERVRECLNRRTGR